MLFDPIPSPGSQQWFENEAHRERIVSAVMDLHRLDLPPGNISDALEIPLSAVDEILDLLGTVRVTEDPPPSYEDAINEGGVTEDPPPSYEDAIKMERVGNNSTSTKVS